MKQLNVTQAVAFGKERRWANFTTPQLAWFQFNQECLACEFSSFHAAVEATLGYPVFTHHFSTLHTELLEGLTMKVSAEDKAHVEQVITNFIEVEHDF